MSEGRKISAGQTEDIAGRHGRPVPPPRVRGGWMRVRSDVLLAVTVALLVVPVLQPLMAQQASRYALTAAVWDEGTVALDGHAHLLTVDRAERAGRTYSDKAPGQPFLALVAYGPYRLLGGHPAAAARSFADPGLWATSLVSAALPAVVLAVLMRRLALRVAPRRATAAALGLAVATLLLPFATVLFSHVLSALLAVLAYLLLSARGAGRGHLAAAGAAAGVAVTVEYTMLLVVALLGLFALAAHRLRSWWFALGGVVPAVLLGWYHTVAFGGPFVTGYRYSQFAAHQEGIVGVRLPRPDMLLQVLAGERGLLTLTPLVLAGVVGCVVLAVRGRAAARRDAVVALAVLGALLFVMGGWTNPTGGASPGPRYVVPALPFLAGGVAWAFQRAPWLTGAATVFGAVAMGLATFTLPLTQPTERLAVGHWVWLVGQGRLADTWLTVATGSDWTLLLPVAGAVAVAVWLLVGEARQRRAAVPT